MTTKKTTTLETLSARHSKQDEIDALLSIVRHYADSQTFLESLFSGGLLEWFSGQAKDDHSTDIYAALVDARRIISGGVGQIADLQKRIRDLEKGLEAARQTFNDELAACRAAHKEFADAWAAQSDRDRQTIARQQADLDEMGRLYSEACGEREAASADRMALEYEVVRLKAEVYDLIKASH